MKLTVGLSVPHYGFKGGIERYAFDLSRDLRARGHRVVLLHTGQKGREPERFAGGFDEVRSASEPGRLDVAYVQRANAPEDLVGLTDVPLLVASHDHDLSCIRSHRYLPLGAVPCHRAPGLRCVAYGCALVRDRSPGRRLPVRIASPARRRIETRALARRAQIVACSAYVAGGIVRAGVDPDRVDVVHPIPIDRHEPVVPPPSDARMLFVGQLLRGKGVDLAIDALGHLPKAVRLTVVGDGPSREALVRHAERVAPGRVTFAGYCSAEEVDAWYDRSAVVVVPSRWPEPFGMVGIEAMRRGRPVVGARHGGIPEWLVDGEGGLTFDPGDPESLATSVERLLADPRASERAAVAGRGFRRTDFVDRIEQRLIAAA